MELPSQPVRPACQSAQSAVASSGRNRLELMIALRFRGPASLDPLASPKKGTDVLRIRMHDNMCHSAGRT